MPAILTSEKNPLLKEVRRAAGRGSLTDDGFALAEGPHLLEEALRSRVEIGAIIAAESAKVPVEAGRVVRVADRTFAALTSTETPQGVLTLVRPPAWAMPDLLRGSALVIVLDRIQDPGNAGAILRAAEAFGATGAVFLKGTVNPYNPKCMRGSAGSVFRVPLVTGVTEDALPDLPLYGASQRAETPPDRTDFLKACAIVIGGEGGGMSPTLQLRAAGVRIPTTGVESLNAAVAAGILLYEARRQRGVA